MRFIIDAQLPPALADWLSVRGHKAAAVRDIGLRDAEDEQIWERAQVSNAVIVTKDEDFAHLAMTRDDGPRVLWIRMGNVLNSALLARLECAWPEIEAHLQEGERLVEVR